jgi:hypothetical protein
MSTSALLLGSSLLLAAVPLAGCSGTSCDDDDCNAIESSPSPTPPPVATPTDFLKDHPHTWAMVRQIDQEVYIYDSPITKAAWYPQVTWSYFLVTWKDKDVGEDTATVEQTEELCGAEASDIIVDTKIGDQRQSTGIPQKLIDSIPPDVWTATLSSVGDGTYSYQLNGPQYSVWGAKLADPLNDECPMRDEAGTSYTPDTLPPEEWDEDTDGNPGVTTEVLIEGDHFADTYICQRLVFHEAASAVGSVTGKGFQVQGGFTDYLNDQSQYWADTSLFEDQDPEVRWSSSKNGTNTYYVMIELPDGATCKDVKPELFQ